MKLALLFNKKLNVTHIFFLYFIICNQISTRNNITQITVLYAKNIYALTVLVLNKYNLIWHFINYCYLWKFLTFHFIRIYFYKFLSVKM